MDTEQTTEAGVIAELAQKASGVAAILKTDDGREFIVRPEEFATPFEVTSEKKQEQLKPLRPLVLAQGVILQAVDSLVDYVGRYKTDDTMLFADIDANAIVAIVDYHVQQSKVTAEMRQANLLKHTARLTLPFSEEWKTWKGIDGQYQEQLAFARFLEENGGDVVAPPGADLLEICRDLQAHRTVNFTKAVRTNTDTENFEYTDKSDLSDKGGIEVPTRFELKLPVYFGEPTTQLFAYLRWTIDPDKGGLKLGVKLSRAEYVRQACFKQIVLGVAERTGCPVVYGKA